MTVSGRCSTPLFEFGIGETCVVVKPLECKRGIASKLNGQLEFTVVLENASDADQRQHELEKQVLRLLTVHCIMYIVECILYNVHCTGYHVHCTIYVHRKLYTLQNIRNYHATFL